MGSRLDGKGFAENEGVVRMCQGTRAQQLGRAGLSLGCLSPRIPSGQAPQSQPGSVTDGGPLGMPLFLERFRCLIFGMRCPFRGWDQNLSVATTGPRGQSALGHSSPGLSRLSCLNRARWQLPQCSWLLGLVQAASSKPRGLCGDLTSPVIAPFHPACQPGANTPPLSQPLVSWLCAPHF